MPVLGQRAELSVALGLALFTDAVIYSAFVSMLSAGFTLTYLTARVPNFAHATISIAGAYVTFSLFLQGISGVYLYIYACPLAFLLIGLVFFFLYQIIIRPLMIRGATIITLAIATVAIEMITLASIDIYADFLAHTFKYFSEFFILTEADFNFIGVPGILFVSVISCAIFVTIFHLILTRTKFGIGLRATVEDSSLAGALGINVDHMCAISWFITGSTCGLVGSLLPLWFQTYPTIGTTLIITLMAGSILGGLTSIYGALIGGFIMGLTEVLVTSLLVEIAGSSIIAYKLLIPLAVMVIVLMKEPNGISGLIERLQASASRYG